MANLVLIHAKSRSCDLSRFALTFEASTQTTTSDLKSNLSLFILLSHCEDSLICTMVVDRSKTPSIAPKQSGQADASTLATAVSILGGPVIQPNDIEWAFNLPSGKDLLMWLTAQLTDIGIQDGLPATDMREKYQASLAGIALEAEELDMYVSLFTPLWLHPTDVSIASNVSNLRGWNLALTSYHQQPT